MSDLKRACVCLCVCSQAHFGQRFTCNSLCSSPFAAFRHLLSLLLASFAQRQLKQRTWFDTLSLSLSRQSRGLRSCCCGCCCAAALAAVLVVVVVAGISIALRTRIY